MSSNTELRSYLVRWAWGKHLKVKPSRIKAKDIRDARNKAYWLGKEKGVIAASIREV